MALGEQGRAERGKKRGGDGRVGVRRRSVRYRRVLCCMRKGNPCLGEAAHSVATMKPANVIDFLAQALYFFFVRPPSFIMPNQVCPRFCSFVWSAFLIVRPSHMLGNGKASVYLEARTWRRTVNIAQTWFGHFNPVPTYGAFAV